MNENGCKHTKKADILQFSVLWAHSAQIKGKEISQVTKILMAPVLENLGSNLLCLPNISLGLLLL